MYQRFREKHSRPQITIYPTSDGVRWAVKRETYAFVSYDIYPTLTEAYKASQKPRKHS